MATDLDTRVDIELLVGEMPAPGCESIYHNSGRSPQGNEHADGGEHYVNIHRPCGCNEPQYGVVRCMKWISIVLAQPSWLCADCNTVCPVKDWVTVLGPVNK